MYPIKFEHLYYEKVWGGRDLERFRNNLPNGQVGESWDIACNKNGTGIVSNGKLKGLTFNELISNYENEIFGKAINDKQFPLLVKLINSQENLSVQVHPNDDYARAVENSYGKTEAWYIIDAADDAEIIVGTNGCSKSEFKDALLNNNVEKYLNKIKIKKGDSFLITSGLVHAIGSGIIIAEIQQNSDITYRLYDYGRPRELHIKKSLDVINFDSEPQILLEDYKVFNGYKYTRLCSNNYFKIDKYVINYKFDNITNNNVFNILTCVDGSGLINFKNGSETITKGDSLLIPATLGIYEIKGSLEILISTPVVNI